MKKNKVVFFVLVVLSVVSPILIYVFTGEVAIWIRIVCSVALLVFVERLLRDGSHG